MEHQVLQAAVQVIWLREPEAAWGAVDDTVLHLPLHAEDKQTRVLILLPKVH